MDWQGILLPLLEKMFPNASDATLTWMIGLVLSILTAIFKPKVPPVSIADQKAQIPTGRPLIVAIPAAAGLILAGPSGVLAAALGDGVRRALWTLIDWTRKRFGIGG